MTTRLWNRLHGCGVVSAGVRGHRVDHALGNGSAAERDRDDVAMRMAAVFTMSTATITLRTKVIPRWIGILGFAVAVVLLISVGLTA